MSINTAYKIANVVDEIGKALRVYEERKLQLFKEYGKDDDEGGMTILEENVQTYQDLHDKLVQEEVDLNIDMISIEMLGDISVTPATLITLNWLIEP